MPADDETDLGPAFDETVEARGADTRRRRLELSLFALALILQLGAIALRISGTGYVEVVIANRLAIAAYQKKVGLKPDGVASRKVLQLLEAGK